MVMKRPMVAFLTQLLLAIRSRFSRRARLEAENLLPRQQLIVLRRRHLRVANYRFCQNQRFATHMIRKGQARWVSDDDVRKQNQFIDKLFDLPA